MSEKTVSAESGSTLKTLVNLWPYMWPADRADLRMRVCQAERTDEAAAAAEAPPGKNRESARAGDLHGSTAAKPTSTPARLGEVPVDIATLEGSFLRKLVQVPGGLQVIMAAVLTIVPEVPAVD